MNASCLGFVVVSFLFCFPHLSAAQSDFGSELSVFIPPEGGQIQVVTDRPVGLRGMDFISDEVIFTQGTNPTPFDFFLTGQNQPENVTQVTLGSLRDVIIDGSATLDVSAQNTNFSAFWGGSGVSDEASVNYIPEPNGNILVGLITIWFLGSRRRKDSFLTSSPASE